MKTKLLTYSEDMARAIKKAAHRAETSQVSFVMRAVMEKLDSLNDPEIDRLTAGQKTALEQAINACE